jgi:DNA-binding response OmpR family regulator
MRDQTILLIDDDPTLRDLLSDHLHSAGYHVQTAADGPMGLRIALETLPDLIVLDVMMPGMDGWEVCRQLRASSSVPIILLTAKGEEMDKLHGFRLGSDDYVTKPFSFAELTARIRAVLARSTRTTTPAHAYTSGDLTIDFDQHRVLINGQIVELTRTEYRLLEVLAHRPNQTVASELLVDAVWGPGYAGEVEQVKHFIWALRKKIEADPGDPKHLITERGFGYRFE